MFNKYIKRPFTDMYEWVASRLPGWKTKIVTALGALGMTAALLQEYISGIPLGEFITSAHLAMVNAGLFTLAFIARTMSR